MFDFLIDTADEKYIKEKWNFLSKHIPAENFRGVTTNPNAFFKMSDFAKQQWFDRMKTLADLIEQIRGDKEGELHVQFPNSKIDKALFTKWLEQLHGLNITNVKIFVKVPPFANGLKIAQRINKKYGFKLNVTGVADAGTALSALSYKISYLSIIPGRMEEVGINAKAHVAFVQSRKRDNKEIITGSMRTIECLKWCVEMGTIPTIGTRVIDQIDETILLQMLKWKNKKTSEQTFCPLIEQKNTDLSIAFFKQMDEMGNQCYEELKQ